jgi:hypothetical protein
VAIKIKKKTDVRDEAKQPDQIYTFTQRVFNQLEKRMVVVGAILGGVLLLIIVVSLIGGSAASSETEAGATVLEAAMLLERPVGEDEAAEGDTRPRFPTLTAQSEAVRSALSSQLAESGRWAAAWRTAPPRSRWGYPGAHTRYQAVVAGADGTLVSWWHCKGWRRLRLRPAIFRGPGNARPAGSRGAEHGCFALGSGPPDRGQRTRPGSAAAWRSRAPRGSWRRPKD